VEVAGEALLLVRNQSLGELKPAQPVNPTAVMPINAIQDADNPLLNLRPMPMAP
jgi:hypothetical protein